ncbi:MAG: hypothetical protein D6767_06230 [Candidatus Hydrogenedentota bacterium]|nr:MAG: hypothetical protein D6767_06230 [Candidatus Hydrogenedentota bacterium]
MSVFSKFFSKKQKPTFKIQIRGTEIVFPARKGQTILEAAEQAGLFFPYNCRVGSCTECKCIVHGEVKELTDMGFALPKEELNRGMRLACQSIPKSDLEIEVTLLKSGGKERQETKGKINQIQDLTHDIKEVHVQLEKPISYIAGQYAQLIHDSIGEPRSYSMAEAPAPKKNKELVFYIRKVPGGAFTEWLFAEDRTGEELKVIAPLGTFFLRDSDSAPIIAVAGGSGLAPIKAVLEAAIGVERPVQFFFGARTQKDLYALEAIEKIKQSWKAPFEFIPALSEEEENSNWKGDRGLITEVMDKKLKPAENAQAYLCGPPGMIDAAVEVLKNHGVKQDHIFMDKFTDKSHLK